MDFVAQRTLLALLRRHYVVPTQEYFCNRLGHLGSFDLHGRIAWWRLEAATEGAVAILNGRPPFVLFTDRLAGWRAVPPRRRNTPVRVGSLGEAIETIRERSHFRDGTTYKDNYYVTDATLAWFLCFCHHDDWHLWLPAHFAQRPAWRQWRRQTGARWEPRRLVPAKSPGRERKTAHFVLERPRARSAPGSSARAAHRGR